MNNKRKAKLNTVTVKNINYKWRVENEVTGSTLKIWKNKSVIIEEWFVSLCVDAKFVEEMIKFEKL